ncbi:MAG: nicotinamide riboside transporter PnuC [Mycoplasmatales bacterium]
MKLTIFKIKFEKFEVIWFTIALVLLFGIEIFLQDTLLGIIVTITGMLNVLLVAKRSMWNYLFGIINVSLYAYVSYQAGYGGDFVTMTFYYLPLQFIGIYTWKNHMKVEANNAAVEYKKFNFIMWAILIVNLIVGTLITAQLLPLITALFGMPINQLPLIDAFTTYAGITAGVLMALRYSEQWWIWIGVNIGSVVMWFTMLGKADNAAAMVIMWSAYLINAIYGLYKWEK